MKAIQIKRFGGPEVFEIVESITPAPGPGQALIRVRAAGVNFAETLMRENRYAVTPELPAVLGTEVAGTIESLGSEANGLAIGARVAAPLFASGQYFGGYADHVLIDANHVVPLPAELSYEDATALMIQGLTALYLTRQAPTQNKVVLITAAAGGVGTFLVQLSRQGGAKTVIAAASSAKKLEHARSLGADAGVNYTETDWMDQVRVASDGIGPDIIFESVGGSVTRNSLEVLAPLGKLVIYGALNIQDFSLGIPELLNLIFKNQSVTGFALAPLMTPESLKEDLAELFELKVKGQLKVTIGATFPLEHAGEAHLALSQRRTTGKVVLAP